MLDTPLQQCLDSIERRFTRERYEKEDTLSKTWEQYQRLMLLLRGEGEEIHSIDASGSPKLVHQRVWSMVAPILGLETDQ